MVALWHRAVQRENHEALRGSHPLAPIRYWEDDYTLRAIEALEEVIVGVGLLRLRVFVEKLLRRGRVRCRPLLLVLSSRLP